MPTGMRVLGRFAVRDGLPVCNICGTTMTFVGTDARPRWQCPTCHAEFPPKAAQQWLAARKAERRRRRLILIALVAGIVLLLAGAGIAAFTSLS